MAEKVKSQPTRAIEIYVSGKSVVKAIGDVTVTTDRPLTDVPAYGMRTFNSSIAGQQMFELSLDIISPADPVDTWKMIMQAAFDSADLTNLFASGGVYEAELPYEDILDQIPIVILAQGLDVRLLETGTSITDLLIPWVSEMFAGCTVRQLLSALSLGENYGKRNLTLRAIERKQYHAPIVIDTFNLADVESNEDCSFLLSKTPLRHIDGQYLVLLVNNEIWRKGYWYDSSNGFLVFDYDNDYCPGYPIGLVLREEVTVPSAPGPYTATLDNVPITNGEVIQNKFDTVNYTKVAAAPATLQYSIAGGVLTFAAADADEVLHAHYFFQNANVPLKNITVIYPVANPNIKAGDAFTPLRGAFGV